ncbi:MAG: glycosyltransferase family 4 protein [Bdellovibrio sp.]|nr:glycosyltransferase family 4 protein [Bdellovibrio sp.]
MKKICFYSISTHLGGAERSLLELVGKLTQREDLWCRPFVLLPKKEGHLMDALRQIGVRHHVIEMPKEILELSRNRKLRSLIQLLLSLKPLRRYIKELKTLLNNEKPDLIHSNAIKCHLISGLFLKDLGIPVLWHVRDILKKGPLLFVLKHLASNKIHIIANSHATANTFLNSGLSVSVIYNGLDLNYFKKKRNLLLHQKLCLPQSTPLVGILGALAKWKGQIEFIRMAKKMIDNGSEAHFLIIGDEIYDTFSEKGFKEVIKEEIQNLKLKDRIHLLGFQKETNEIINGLDVLVHASIRPEPFGRVIIEAMACEVPVVCSAAGGVLEIVDNGKTGLLFSPGNAKEMAACVFKLLEDKELCNKLTSNALKNVDINFNLHTQTEKIATLYKQILSRHNKI